jgi:hypothetical protein
MTDVNQVVTSWLRTISFYVVASKCLRNHFISMRYKIAKLFKAYFLQNNPLVQIYTFARDCKSWEKLREVVFQKPFQLSRRILHYVTSITNARSV